MINLKNVLTINALSSGATGLLLAALPSYVSKLIGVKSEIPVAAVGVFLILFAVLVFIQSRKSPLQKGWIKIIVSIDVLWVLESLLLVFPNLFSFSSIGYIAIISVALWVALMAYLQVLGLKKLQAYN